MILKTAHFNIALILAACLLAAYLGLIIFGDNGVVDLNAKKERLAKITAENEKLEDQNVQLYRKITRMKEDPVYIEDTARQELKMIREDEIIFKFSDRKTIPPALPKTTTPSQNITETDLGPNSKNTTSP